MQANNNKKHFTLIDILAVITVLFSIGYVVAYYGSLPEEIPTHFHATGEPNSWGGKQLLIGLLILHIFVFKMMFFMNLFIRKSDQALKFLNIPTVNPKKLSDDQKVVVQRLSSQMMSIINLIVAILFFTIIYGMIHVGLGKQDGLGATTLICTIILIIIPIIYMFKIIKAAKVEQQSDKHMS
ncbi:protein of unknown function DUF1648 [Evansella cellulosilytica DSM 2522]|uniref:DUF1648 domain-containing protein n=2 Tax=Evansella TaxID=2837485 RepID=E6TZ68_EVAC2|nr:protein of unknown function DUF1648 [Evansella cellulosilytica DSM 2522]